MKEGDLVLLKTLQVKIARKLRRESGFIENEVHLNAVIFTNRGRKGNSWPCLYGFIFEQEYYPKNDRCPPAKLVQELNEFSNNVPKDTRYHIELRTEAYLADSAFEVLKKHGAGLVFSHWTWLPPLRKQFAKARGESDELRGILCQSLPG